LDPTDYVPPEDGDRTQFRKFILNKNRTVNNVQKHNNYITPTGWLRILAPDHHFYIAISLPTLGYCSTLKMEAADSAEMLATVYRVTRHDIREDSNDNDRVLIQLRHW
jgi:hypothetical protein